MKRRGPDLDTVLAVGILVCFAFLILGVTLLTLAAYDWDWRCVFAQCRVYK